MWVGFRLPRRLCCALGGGAVKSEMWGDIRNAPLLKVGTFWRTEGSDKVWTLESVSNKFGRTVYLIKGGVTLRVHLFDFYEDWHEVTIDEMIEGMR